MHNKKYDAVVGKGEGATPEQGPLLEYPPNIKYAESWLFLYNTKNQTYIFPYNASEYAL